MRAHLLSSSSVEISDEEVVDFADDVSSSSVEVVVDRGVVVGVDAVAVPAPDEVLDVSTPVDVALLSVLLEVQSVISFSILSTNEVQENLGLILLGDNRGLGSLLQNNNLLILKSFYKRGWKAASTDLIR